MTCSVSDCAIIKGWFTLAESKSEESSDLVWIGKTEAT